MEPTKMSPYIEEVSFIENTEKTGACRNLSTFMGMPVEIRSLVFDHCLEDGEVIDISTLNPQGLSRPKPTKHNGQRSGRRAKGDNDEPWQRSKVLPGNGLLALEVANQQLRCEIRDWLSLRSSVFKIPQLGIHRLKTAICSFTLPKVTGTNEQKTAILRNANESMRALYGLKVVQENVTHLKINIWHGLVGKAAYQTAEVFCNLMIGVKTLRSLKSIELEFCDILERRSCGPYSLAVLFWSFWCCCERQDRSEVPEVIWFSGSPGKRQPVTSRIENYHWRLDWEMADNIYYDVEELSHAARKQGYWLYAAGGYLLTGHVHAPDNRQLRSCYYTHEELIRAIVEG